MSTQRHTVINLRTGERTSFDSREAAVQFMEEDDATNLAGCFRLVAERGTAAQSQSAFS